MNMDDEKVRELLSRYRPVAPREQLRGRALSAPPPRQRSWPWAAAAAALIAATVGVHAAANRAVARQEPASPGSESALATALGDDAEARRAARVIVAEQAFRAWITGEDGSGGMIEEIVNGSN